LDARPQRGGEHEAEKGQRDDDPDLPEREDSDYDRDSDEGRRRRPLCGSPHSRGIPCRKENEADVSEAVIEAHRHGIALARPLLRASVFAVAGAACFLAPWPVGALGAVLLGLAAVIAVVGVARSEATHLFVTHNS